MPQNGTVFGVRTDAMDWMDRMDGMDWREGACLVWAGGDTLRSGVVLRRCCGLSFGSGYANAWVVDGGRGVADGDGSSGRG